MNNEEIISEYKKKREGLISILTFDAMNQEEAETELDSFVKLAEDKARASGLSSKSRDEAIAVFKENRRKIMERISRDEKWKNEHLLFADCDLWDYANEQAAINIYEAARLQ